MAVEGVPDRKVVIDAGAAIKLQRLERFGSEIYTTRDVLSEIKDDKARALLDTMPIDLKVHEPAANDVAFVKVFAKETGDLGFLSMSDIGLIALAVSLQREAGGEVRNKPPQIVVEEGYVDFSWGPTKPKAVSTVESEPAPLEKEDEGGEIEDGWSKPTRRRCVKQSDAKPANLETLNPKFKQWVEDDDLVLLAEDAVQPDPASEEVDEELCSGDEEVCSDNELVCAADELSDGGSSEGEWITPENMYRFGLGVEPAGGVKVACATADYTVQNVLLQMGITPLTFDGYAVLNVKIWGMVCRGCFFFTRDSERVFCKKCGHSTLVRVPIIVDNDGKVRALNAGRPLKRKGAIYSIPKPKGGRGFKPIFAEDEMMIGSRDRELRHTRNMRARERRGHDLFDGDNLARQWWQRGSCNGKVIGTAPVRVQAGYGRRNPNAVNFRHKDFGRAW